MGSKIKIVDVDMSREFGGQKQMQNTLKTLYLKRKLTGRESVVIDYLTTKQDNYIPAKQIAEKTGFDYRSTIDILNNLYLGSLIQKKVQKYYPCAKIGGLRNETLFKVDLMAIACLPLSMSVLIPYIHNKGKRKVSIIAKLVKKNMDLMIDIFN